MDNDILVSIGCITYNHEKYIGEAIESFLNQKVNFKYEILIHDDASTDNTANIIRGYEEKYPDIIKPIYQAENQYSKGSYPSMINLERAKGKYIALCEGDDYWTDCNKLQKQIDYMEQHKDCTLCFHNAKVINTDGVVINSRFLPRLDLREPYFYNFNREYTTEEVILLDFIPTASLLFPKEAIDNLPSFCFSSICEDLPWRLVISSRGYAYCINEVMSAYRTGVEGSASSRAQESVESINRVVDGHLKILDQFNEFTDFRYNKEIEKVKEMKEATRFYSFGDIKQLKTKKYKPYYRQFCKRMKFRTKILYEIKYYLPFLHRVYVKIREKM